jgi:hypothetical protein
MTLTQRIANALAVVSIVLPISLLTHRSKERVAMLAAALSICSASAIAQRLPEDGTFLPPANIVGAGPGSYWAKFEPAFPGKFFFTIPPGMQITATTNLRPFFTRYEPPAPVAPPPQHQFTFDSDRAIAPDLSGLPALQQHQIQELRDQATAEARLQVLEERGSVPAEGFLDLARDVAFTMETAELCGVPTVTLERQLRGYGQGLREQQTQADFYMARAAGKSMRHKIRLTINDCVGIGRALRFYEAIFARWGRR